MRTKKESVTRLRYALFTIVLFAELLSLVFQIRNGHLAAEDLIEGDNGFRTSQAKRLKLVVDNIHEIAIVLGEHLDEHIVRSCGVMALNHLRNLLQSLDNIVEF